MPRGQGVQLLSVVGLIRFDVEDFLTPESDHALEQLMRSMHRHEMPGSYGLVGKKVQALLQREQKLVLEWLQAEPALGFHSTSHSEHPTIAEELQALDYETAKARLVAREASGVEMVEKALRMPMYFTQPGANWVPETLEALDELGMDTFFSDSWNSYLIDLPYPYWYGDVLYLGFRVQNPRPFGLRLPQVLDQAVAMVEEAQNWPDGHYFMIMMHPTELVTTAFWDAVNFGQGQTHHPLVPAPLRPAEDQARALHAFDAFLERIRRLPRIRWENCADVRRAVLPREPVVVLREPLLRSLARDGLGPIELPTGTVSAAEAVSAAAYFWLNPRASSVRLRTVQAPSTWPVTVSPAGWPVADSRLRQVAQHLAEVGVKGGRLPDTVCELALPDAVAALWHAQFAKAPPLRWRFLEYVKEPHALHWDWPIFPPGFQPMRFWHDARRLAWTLKRAQIRGERRQAG